MSDKVIDYILIGAGVLLGMPVALLSNSTEFGVFLWFLVIVAVFAGGKAIIGRKRDKQGEEQSKHYTFNKEDGTMTLLQRSKISYGAVHWDPLYEHDLKYHPSKTIYTGASSGGVAMGGFHTTEAYYQERPTKKSGRYIAYLSFHDGSRIYIKEIILVGKVLDEAKSNPKIRKFLKGDRLLLLNKNAKSKLDGVLTASEITNGGTVIQHAYMDSLQANVGITLAEAEQINEWLKGN